ncbi:hypothetical protein PIECOFPK_00953 [Mycovorax composti]|uniref:Carboxypeptidase regulatory-like domain-containing protein n=1 Tax=Mycovorax composti TaxID=2962693 RepID=A0ABZ2EIE4_9BACT
MSRLTKLIVSLPVFLVFSSLMANAQPKKPINFVIGNTPTQSPAYKYTIKGYGGTYATNRNYELIFGQKNANTPSFNRVVKLFDIQGESYSVTKGVSGEKPFKKVIIRRSSGSTKTTALFEIPNELPTNVFPNNYKVYMVPDYVGTMENLINSYTINRGTDNVFVNDAATTTNIERVDLILENPVSVHAVTKNTSGFLLMERGGNDDFKVAAITGLSGDNITKLATPSLVKKSDWGATGVQIPSIVLQGEPNALKPSQNISTQMLSGVFIPLSALNVSAGETIYGLSLFAADVNLSGADLLNISKYPTNTKDNSGGYSHGLDLMAGGGFFTRAILVKGKIWKDESLDAIINNGENGIDAGIWVNLVDPNGKVVSSVQTKNDGSYTLYTPDNSLVDGGYKVILTTREYYEGDVLTHSERPDGYGYTGVNVGGVPDVSNKSGIINIGAIDGNSDDITEVNFGVLDEHSLPVTFGSIQAYIKNNELFVLWSTLSEVGNSRFEIEASYDGKNFFKIGEVASQAEGGNSSSELQYSFQKKISASLLFIPVLAAVVLMLFAFNRKNKLWALSLLFAMVSSFGFYSCKKSDQAFTKDADKLFIRIKQIDLDNQYEYSKTVQVIKY